MWLRILLLSWCNKLLLVFACDLYVASKCPQLPATNEFNINSETYCKHIKDHIDCINSKLKLCKRVQEYGPALETIKANLKVFILQGSNHGCRDLIDKIKLPRIPRKKLTTTTVFVPKEKDQIFIDANCNRKVIDANCEKLDSGVMKYMFNDNSYNDSVVIVNDANCKNYLRYNSCMQQNFRVRCQQTLKQVFYKLDKITTNCNNVNNLMNRFKINHRPTQSSANSLVEMDFNSFLFLNLLIQIILA